MKTSPGIMLIWRFAVSEAERSQHEFIEPEHFVQAMTRGESLSDDTKLKLVIADEAVRRATVAELAAIQDTLASIAINAVALRRSLRVRLGKGNHPHVKDETFHRSERCRSAFAMAETLAAEGDSRYVQLSHLFLAILRQKDSHLLAALAAMGCDPDAMGTTLEKRLRVSVRVGAEPDDAKDDAMKGTPWLDKYGRDLTAEAKSGKLGPVIGRRKEILQVLQTLARSSKNNPVLIGDPGVGKTAIVEALAIRIVEGKDEKVLAGKRIVEIRPGALVAGTKYRGEFEERLQKILGEAKTHTEIILFIDEIHLLVGAGAAGSGMDAANLMKPALARGEIRCIGATTIEEYRRFIETDAALERRLEKIVVDEPSKEETLEILRGLRGKLEIHHGVKITDKALLAAIDLTMRFDHDRRLPDKAIDALDLAGARVCVPRLSMQVKAGEKPPRMGRVTPDVIAAVLADKLQLPTDILTGNLGDMTQDRMAKLESRLKAKIIGQDKAIQSVCERLLVASVGVTERRGPLAVFLFAGPTGVGKTELAKALAQEVLGGDKALIRLDMSEYMEQHSVAKLIGSPPGYVGYEEEGQLTGKLRSQPHSLVLLDEVEKAHPRVLDMFLQLFDEGRLTDAKGRTVDARNSIFVMTSNIMVESRKAELGFGAKAKSETGPKIGSELKKHFRAEFINRIDEIILFTSLKRDAIKAIAHKFLDEIAGAVEKKYKKRFRFEDSVVSILLEKSCSEEYGARDLLRVIQEIIEIPLTKLLVSLKSPRITSIRCVWESEKIVLRTE
jgi:ATP-dependent Clp protease ATP-binding subunit ClpC